MNLLRFWCFLGSALLAIAPAARGEKIWTNALSGFWQDGTNWTGHSAPDITSFIRITNANTKTVTIDSFTPAANLTVQKLTLSAPPGATNTLFLKDAGTNNPLTFQTGLDVQDGGALRITNSALLLQLTNDHFNLDGSITLDSGFIDFGDTTVTSRVGRATSGVLTINAGAVSAGALTIGGLTNSTGVLNMTGGSLLVSSLMSIGRNLTTTGTVSLLGGRLSVPNDDTRVGDQGIGIMVMSNATATLTNLQVGRDPSSSGTLTLQQSSIIQIQSDVPIGRFTGSTGVVNVAGGQLLARGLTLYVGRGGNGQLNLSNGIVQVSRLLVAADTTNSIGSTGLFAFTGGTLVASSDFLVGSPSYSTGQVVIAGGMLGVTNGQGTAVAVVASGALNLDGGAVMTDNLFLTNAGGQFRFSSGTLDSKSTTVANGSPFVVGNGTSAAVFHLSGGTHIFADGLIISSNATLDGCGTLVGNIINHGIIATNCGSVAVAPGIVGQPASQVIGLGSTLSLSVSATGTQPLSYQWEVAGLNLAGANASSYVKPNIQITDAGNYTVVITNAAGAITSEVATVTVLMPPFITTPPQSQTVIAGSNVTFSVAATGALPLSYQWQLGGANLAGATTNSYSKADVQPADAGNYAVVIANAAGSVTSAAATLTVLVPPSITAGPQSNTASIGSAVTFSVTAAGTQPLAYQWQLGGTNLAGATTSSYTRANVKTTDAGIYTVVITNMAGAITSPPASLQVLAGLSVAFVGRTGSTNTVSVQSAAGTSYTLQFKDSLDQTSWTDVLPSTTGTVGLLLLRDPSAAGPNRFYRVRSQ